MGRLLQKNSAILTPTKTHSQVNNYTQIFWLNTATIAGNSTYIVILLQYNQIMIGSIPGCGAMFCLYWSIISIDVKSPAMVAQFNKYSQCIFADVIVVPWLYFMILCLVDDWTESNLYIGFRVRGVPVAAKIAPQSQAPRQDAYDDQPIRVGGGGGFGGSAMLAELPPWERPLAGKHLGYLIVEEMLIL